MGDIFDNAPTQPQNQSQMPPTPAPGATPAPDAPAQPQDIFGSPSSTPAPAPSPDAPVGTISARTPGFFERVGRMFTEPMRSARGDAYYRDNPEKKHEGLVAPEELMTESEKHDHPIATGVGEFAGGLTSPESLLMLVATEGLGAATPFLRGGMKILPRLVSAGFGAQMMYGAYKQYPEFKAALDAGDASEAERVLTHIVLSGAMAAQATQHAATGEGGTSDFASKRAEMLRARKASGAATEVSQQRGTVAGDRTTIRPTTQTTAGVEAPIAATQQADAPLAARVAQRFTTPGATRDFQKNQTLPAAQKQITSALGQVMQDAISNHQSIASGIDPNGSYTDEALSNKGISKEGMVQNSEGLWEFPKRAGSQVPSRFQTLDEAAQAGEQAAKRTWKKGDDIDTRETAEWKRKTDEVRQQIDEHNKLVEEHNSNLGEGDTPMAPMVGEELLPEKPKTLAELRGEWSRAKANSRSSDPAVRQEAFDNEIPNAEKSLDKWFKGHVDDISPEEYNSVKRLTFQHERMQDIANKLRGPMDTGTLTGNKLRNIEASFNNRGAKYGRPNAFKELLGPEGYENWRTIAKVLDPLKGPNQIERGLETFSSLLLGHLMPVGVAAKFGTEFILNRALFDPKWGQSFTKAFANFKLTGKVRPSDQRSVNDLMKFARMTDDELKQAGFTQAQIDAGEHLPTVGGGAPETVEDDANRFNTERNRPPIRRINPSAHPQGREIADAYDEMAHDPSDPKVKASYDSMKSDIDDQWNHAVQSGYTLEPWNSEGQPYANSKQMSEDVNHNRHLSFFTGGDLPADHPLAEVDSRTGFNYNEKFRAIHDLFGHAGHGHEFGPKGEEAAYRTHAQMFSPESIPALTSETRGQNNWVNNGPHMQDAEGNVLKKGQKGYIPPTDRPYAANKAGLLPEEFHGDGGVPRDIADMHNENGGFTYNPNRGFIGGEPVFSVGLPDAPSEVFPKEKLTVKDVRNFLERPKVREALQDPRNSVGGWNYKNHATLEISRTFDNREEAIAEGKKNNQTAIFDHANQTDIPTGGTSGDEGLKSETQKTIDRMKERYGTTSDPLKAGFILPEGDMIPLVGEHDQMLGGRPTDNLRESFIQDSGAIRSRYRMSRAGEEQVFSLPKEITEEQARQIKYAAGKLRNGRITLETVDGKNHSMLDFPTGAKVQDALDGMVKIKSEPEVEVLDEPSDVNASGESAASQEAIGRVASEKAQGITRVRVKKNGEEVPLFGPDAVDATAGKGETIVKRFADGREEVQDSGAGANYRGPKPKGDIFEEPKAMAAAAGAEQAPTDVADEAQRYLDELEGKAPKVGNNPASEIPTTRGESERDPAQQANWDAIERAAELAPDRETAAGTPVEGYLRRMLNNIVAKHPDLGVKITDADIENPRQALDKITNHWSDNLTWLHDSMPEAFREASKQWYDTAHQMSQTWAKQYGVPVEKVAGVIAALSPKNNWDVNAGQAKRMLDMYTNMRDHEWSDKMDDVAKNISKRVKSDYKKAIKAIRGKKFDEINTGDPKVDLYLKGLWLRMLDEAHGGDTTELFHPSGKVRGHTTMMWGMPEPMAKAVAMLESDGSPDEIHRLMGDGHKIRNFYNNIVSPNSEHPHVTVDTHAGNASMLAPRGSDAPEIANIFGGAPASANAGLKGLYPLHAEAYQRAAAKLGIRPRELQSITWEGIRSLFGDKNQFGRGTELEKTISDVWESHREGRLTIDQAREKIVEATGGFKKPDWMTEAEWNDANGTDFSFGANAGGN